MTGEEGGAEEVGGDTVALGTDTVSASAKVKSA